MILQMVMAVGFFGLAVWAVLTGRPDEGHQLLQTALLCSILAELQK